MDNFVARKFGNVYHVDDGHLDIVGKVDVHKKTAIRYQWKLQDIIFVSDLKRNLIFLCQLNSIGYITIFGDCSWKIVQG